MSDELANSAGQADLVELPSLSDADISQLILASSLSATRPLLGLINFMIKERILDGDKLKEFLGSMLVADGLPPTTREMLRPIWNSLLAQIGASSEASRHNGKDEDVG